MIRKDDNKVNFELSMSLWINKMQVNIYLCNGDHPLISKCCRISLSERCKTITKYEIPFKQVGEEKKVCYESETKQVNVR